MTVNGNDKRLIEDYLPIEAISVEAVREKSCRQGHLSTLHLWWARRPLVAARAAVYGSLAQAPASEGDRAVTAEFVETLCRYPGSVSAFQQARKSVLEAHRTRNTEAGPESRPRVLDLFAGGGAIPLEALRLGADAYAVELNPVAYLIDLCTLVFPQKYGGTDSSTKGAGTDGNWAGLVEEVRNWGTWILKRVRGEIGDLYPLEVDPKHGGRHQALGADFWGHADDGVAEGYLLPVAYLWTRTVRCPRPDCGGTVPLARQTWLARKEGKTGSRYVAARGSWDRTKKRMQFTVAEAKSLETLGFDPAAGSTSGRTTCPGCHAPIDSDYVKKQGKLGRIGVQHLATVCAPSGEKRKSYLSPGQAKSLEVPGPEMLQRAEALATRFGFSIPDEPLEANPRSFDVQLYGFDRWRDVFTPRQLIAMTAFAGTVRDAHAAMMGLGYDEDRALAVTSCLSMVLGRLADYCTSFCTWQPEFIKNTFSSPGLPMIMDFAEANPLADSSGGWPSALRYVCDALQGIASIGRPAVVVRGSALATPWEDASFDAVVTDPPYYDSRSYSNLSDHFYVWHKRAVGHLYAEHFAAQLTPKKAEAIAAAYRHGGDWNRADAAYEAMMQRAFAEAHRVLRPGSPMVCVYAHKTTAGWATLINALRNAGFVVVEAWAVEMERKARQNAIETAALASSILLVARRREGSTIGSYEEDVRPELEQIVVERIDTLWPSDGRSTGVIQGGDLVIAAVGAGLRAFTRFARVEYRNGEEVPAERFLAEVETVVLETILTRLSRDVGGTVEARSLANVDVPTRFYLLWRYTYRWTELDAGEAIVFANGVHAELEGPGGLSSGPRPLVEKKKSKYRLLDFGERGSDSKLGLRSESGEPAPLIDALQRILWLLEHRPIDLADFLREASPNREQMRLVAQALAGPALRGGEVGDISPTGELAALAKLTANWRSVIEGDALTSRERAARHSGQAELDLRRAERQ